MASVGRRWWKEGDGARPIRGTRGQRVENPRWTEKWRGVLRHVPQRTVRRPPCVPLALSGYGCELRSCTSTARRPYGIPTRTVWYCIGRWSQVRREEAGRGPACGAAHRRTPIKGSRHVRVRRPVSPAADAERCPRRWPLHNRAQSSPREVCGCVQRCTGAHAKAGKAPLEKGDTKDKAKQIVEH